MMRSDMTVDVFAQHGFGKAALQKFGQVSTNFRLYEAGLLGNQRDVMKVKGAEFRCAKTGPNAGKMTVMVPGTSRTVYVTRSEIAAFDGKGE